MCNHWVFSEGNIFMSGCTCKVLIDNQMSGRSILHVQAKAIIYSFMVTLMHVTRVCNVYQVFFFLAPPQDIMSICLVLVGVV